jgi:hypothetical protein
MLFHVNAGYLGMQPAALPVNYAFLGLRSASDDSPVIPLPQTVTTYVGNGNGIEYRKPSKFDDEDEELLLLYAILEGVM